MSEHLPTPERHQGIRAAQIIREFLSSVGDEDYDLNDVIEEALQFLQDLEQSLDVTHLSEPDLIELSTVLPNAVQNIGKLAMDEYMKRRGEVIGQAMENRRLESEIQAKFAHLSDAALMSRMSRAPDFGYDDEEVELTRRLKLGGAAWRWSNDFFNPKIEVYKPEATPDV